MEQYYITLLVKTTSNFKKSRGGVSRKRTMKEGEPAETSPIIAEGTTFIE